MKFDNAINRAITGKLKRIRIKVDPVYASSEDFQAIDSYEGYVLEENEEQLRIMVIKTGMPIVNVPKDALLKASHLELFKTFIQSALQFAPDDAIFTNIFNAQNFESIEDQLQQIGCSDSEVLSLYREFIKEHGKDEEAAELTSEASTVPTRATPPTGGFLNTLGRASARAAGKAVRGTAASLGKIVTDPKGFTRAGVGATLKPTVNAIKDIPADIPKIKRELIDRYYARLDLPKGWPTRGSDFEIDASDGVYTGKVANIQKISNNFVCTIDTTSEESSDIRRYVVEFSTASRPYFAIKSVMVSDKTSRGFAKNEQESGHNFVFKYESTTLFPNGVFRMSHNKTYEVFVWVTTENANLVPGSAISGSDIKGNTVEGVVQKLTILKDKDGKEGKAWVVDANFK